MSGCRAGASWPTGSVPAKRRAAKPAASRTTPSAPGRSSASVKPRPDVDRHAQQRKNRCGHHLDRDPLGFSSARQRHVRRTDRAHRRERLRPISPRFVVLPCDREQGHLGRLLVQHDDVFRIRIGQRRRTTAFSTVKTAVLAPIPSVSVRMTTAENAGRIRRLRIASRMSCIPASLLSRRCTGGRLPPTAGGRAADFRLKAEATKAEATGVSCQPNQLSAISGQQSAVVSNQQSAISNQQSAISNQQSAISNQ